MVLSYFFFFSGAVMVVLMIAKRIEEKKRKTLYVLRLISRGDEYCRKLHARVLGSYSSGKERAYFMVAKQLPRYSRSSLNKAVSRLEDKMSQYLERLRDSHLLKKDEGISEYFKSISEVEKGGGEINQEAFVVEEPKPKRIRKPRTKKIVVQEFVEME